MRLNDALFGAGFVLIGAVVFVSTLRFPRLDGGAPGPGLFPQVVAVLMIVAGGVLAWSARPRRAAEARAAPLTAVAPGLGARGVVNTLMVFAAIIAFMVVSPPVGFLVTSFAILFALMWHLGTRPLRAALAAAGLTLFVYVLFGKVLRVPLPLGVLWF